jgi:uncharacterized protein (DUF302 family)
MTAKRTHRSKAALMVAASALLAANMPYVTVQPAHAKSVEPAQWIVKTSPHDVETTVAQLKAAVEKAGAKVFAVIDHQAGAKSAGLELDPTTLVIFGNPKIGTPIIQADRNAALDLPIRVLVWSEQGRTRIGVLSPEEFKRRYDVKNADKALQMMGKALNNLLNAAIAS